MLDKIELKKFLEETAKVEHSIKSALGRINKTIQNVDNFIANFKLEYNE